MYRSEGNQQQVPTHGTPAVPQSGPVMYGSGLVFGGTVYPVLVDGVPMQPPVVAHQTAVQQRMQMQQGHQAPHAFVQTSQTVAPKPVLPQRAFQRVGAPAGTSFRVRQTPPRNQQSFGRFPGPAAGPGPSMQRQPQYNNNYSMMQQQQQQQLAAMGRSFNFNYNQQPSGGGDGFSSWSGYAMMQPMDASRPYTFGFSN